MTPSGVNRPATDGLASPGMSHRSPRFVPILKDVRNRVVRCLGGDERYGSVLLGTSGTGAVEAMMGAARDPVLIIENGRYSRRLTAIAAAQGHEVRSLHVEDFDLIDEATVGRALAASPRPRTLALVHCETTTGVLAPLQGICGLAAGLGVNTMVDAVGSVGAHSPGLGQTGPDWLAAGSGKGTEAIPGLSFVVARRSLLADAEPGRAGYLLDVGRNWKAQEAGAAAHTLPIPLVVALNEALRRWESETPAARERRYTRTATALRKGLQEHGFEIVPLHEEARSNVVIPVVLPLGVDFAQVQAELVERDMEVYYSEDAQARGYFVLAHIGGVDPDAFEEFLRALTTSCRAQLTPALPQGGECRA
ncbi:2-aminoethylphosphonate-pyruvate transaminase [Kribbella steppae]|uniref:2-aminoethylphosphonate-pyruvate transaminase n=2 Tax=Kribbella steppae TaxID=2512223 RepID=A0A4V2RXT5_9ACTN|nr:2-aminoethylphosphonate-pyruvate transaminase [Kribbella steppae]